MSDLPDQLDKETHRAAAEQLRSKFNIAFAGVIPFCMFEHIVLWAGLVYVDHLAVHHLFTYVSFWLKPK